MQSAVVLLVFFSSSFSYALHEWTNATMNDRRGDAPCVSPGSCDRPKHHAFSNVVNGNNCVLSPFHHLLSPQYQYISAFVHSKYVIYIQVRDQDFNGILMVDFAVRSAYSRRLYRLERGFLKTWFERRIPISRDLT